MSSTVSDFVIDRLIAWDPHQFYEFPGDGIGGFDGGVTRTSLRAIGAELFANAKGALPGGDS